MQRIPLTQNQFAIVDDDEYEYLSQFKWYAAYDPNLKSYYAIRRVKGEDGETTEKMHREITEFRWAKVDHINHDTLDNRKENLRDGTLHNQKNRRISTGMSSKYHGVHWDKSNYRWRARIYLDRKRIDLGSFKSEEAAARAYDAASLRYHGEYGTRNFPSQ